MGKRSRRTGNREERNLVAQLPGARKISRSGYSGPDIEWRGREIEVKYRTDGFALPYRWLRDVQILAIRRPREPWLMVLPINDELLDGRLRSLVVERRSSLVGSDDRVVAHLKPWRV